MNVLILAAGESVHGDTDPYPVWLTEVDGQLMIERQIGALVRLDPSRFIVCIRAVDNDAFHIDGILRIISPRSEVVTIKRPTAGAACTALLAIDKVDLGEELLIVNATDQHAVDFVEIVERFRASDADGGILTFESLHPRYSYVRLDENGHVVEVAEKRPISREANAGFYWFRSAGAFFAALQGMMLKDAHVNGRFYVAPALNELILEQKIIRTIRLPKDAYIPVKSPRQLVHYEHAADEGSTP